VFVMTPHDGSSSSSKDEAESGVRVWYARDVCGVSLGAEGLTAFHRALIQTGVVDRGTYYAFVDGPEPNDATNFLHSQYDYLCSSSSIYLALDESGQPNERLWRMDGWLDDEADDFRGWLSEQGSSKPRSGGLGEAETGDGISTKAKARKKTGQRRHHGGEPLRHARGTREGVPRANRRS
jgi:hypothetical protein